MLEALKKHFSPSTASVQLFDASQIDDPFAQKISWLPVEEGGTIYRTHKLCIINTNRVELLLFYKNRSGGCREMLRGDNIKDGFGLFKQSKKTN